MTNLDELEPFEAEWRRLAEQRSNPFLTPEWLRCWWEHYGEGRRLLVPVLTRADGGLRGLLPLAVETSRRPRTYRIAGANLGDVFHPLSRPEDEAAVGAAASRALADTSGWSLLYLDNIDRGEWLDELVASSPRPLRAWERSSSGHAAIQLGDYADWEAYVASRSSKLRAQIRRNERRLEGQGVSARRTRTEDEIEVDIATFFRLHDLRLRARSGSTLSTEGARHFHADFAAAALRRGWLRLWFLETEEGEAIAAWYGWLLGGVYLYYNTGFDPEWSRYGPGAALLARAIRASIEEGAERFDFLLGEEPYKLRFGESSREVVSVVVARAGSPASLLAGADIGLRRLGGRLPDRFGRGSRVARGLARLLPGARRS